MRVFVTGATGVIGRRLVPHLVDAGHFVTAVARTEPQGQQLRRQGAAPIQLDLFDAEAVRTAISGHEAIINLATSIPPASRAFLPGAWKKNDLIRRVASRNLVQAGLDTGVAHFVQESFAGIYPDCGAEWITEKTTVSPAKYVRSMLDAEAQVRHFVDGGGAGVTLRFALFYGVDSSHTLDTIAYARKGKATTFGSPSAFISSVSTDDAATAAVAALNVPAGIYNVVDDEPVTKRQYFESLARALSAKPPTFFPAWMSKLFGSLGKTIARSQRLSNRKLKAASGWQPRYRSVAEGWPAIVRQLEKVPSDVTARFG